MSKKERLLQKIRENKRNVSQKDFEALVREYGWIEEGGKHPKAIVGNSTMPYRREKRIKTCYVTELLQIIDSLE